MLKTMLFGPKKPQKKPKLWKKRHKLGDQGQKPVRHGGAKARRR
jgi:hypothetical protein